MLAFSDSAAPVGGDPRSPAHLADPDAVACLDACVRQSGIGLAEADLNGRLVRVNARFCEIAGRSEKELLTLSVRDITHPDDWDQNLALIDRVFADGKPYMLEKRFVRPDAGSVWVQISASARRDPGGRMDGLFAVCMDVTEHRQTEQALRRTEANFRLFVESVTDHGIFFLDAEGRITSWNLGAERIKGYTAEEVIGRPMDVLYTPEQIAAGQAASDLAQARTTGRYAGQDWRQRKDGTRFWSEEFLTRLPESAGEPVSFAVVCRDLTAAVTAEQERTHLLAAEQAARRDAEAANRTKDRFLASLSHELRTPLTPVRFALYGLQREPGLSPSGRAMLDIISRNLDAEVHLIDDLLDVNRAVHGKLDLQREPLNVHACLFDTLEVCRADFDAKRMQLSVDFRATQDGMLGDVQRLKQVFWNLCKNAVKFTPAEGRVAVHTSTADGAIVVAVSDNGVGLDPELPAKIFDPFEQGEPGDAGHKGGLGLGLAISHAIVTAHGGRLSAASPGRNRGSTFTVTLPLQPARPEVPSVDQA